MNNNATMFNRLVAVFLDLVAFLGYLSGVVMMFYSTTELGVDVHKHLITQDDLIRYAIIVVSAFFILDILFIRTMATTPGKLMVNCDVDFHNGNTIIHCFLRSLIKVICLFTVIPGIISYFYGMGDIEGRALHDRVARSNVTNTTRMPKWIGVVIVLFGVALLGYFLYTYRNVFDFKIDLGLAHYKVFDLSS